MVLKNKRIGVAMTGSFCTYTKAFEQIDRLLEEGAILQTIFSDISQHIKCRFGKGEEFVKRAHDMTGNEPMKTIEEAEIIGPTGCLDILILMPCTGNTMAKLANGITDNGDGGRRFYYVYADCFSILRRCGISSEPELPEIFHLLSVDRNRISGRIRNILCNRTMGMDLSDW